MALVSLATDQRGVALPMALLTLLILSVLVIGFVVLSSTEPTIANNHLMVAQARALAEAGIERAIWALTTNVIPTPLGVNGAPAPYDGSQLVLASSGGINIGGFKVTVANGAVRYERIITSVGWVPNDTSAGPKGRQKVTVVVTNPALILKDPPAAVSVRGELEVGGNTSIDSRYDQSDPDHSKCGKKMGTLTIGLTNLNGNAADVYGATDDNNTRNEFTDTQPSGNIPPNPHDIVTYVNTQTFDQFILSDADINALRTYAKAHGTYLQHEAGGSITFSSSYQIPNGVVFVDTTTGNNITQEGVTPATPSSEFAKVTVSGNAINGNYVSGVFFVNGKLTIDGNFSLHGLVYVQNDLTYHGIGISQVDGAIVSRNIRDTSPISIDSDLLGNSKVNYNCDYVRRGGGTIPSRWTIKGGTYKEVSGS